MRPELRVGMSRAALATLVAIAGCSGKTKGVEDAPKHPVETGSAAAHDDTLPPPSGKGDVQLRVEWKDVPVDARASAGRTACGTPRAPSVNPTTTWGVPDVFVTLDVPKPKAATTTEARVVLDHCALEPRVAIASDKLTLASASEQPAKLTIAKAQDLPFGATGQGTPALPVYLPIAGHSVEVPLGGRGIYLVQIQNADGTGADAETAWVVAADSPFYGITEPNGQTILRDIPVGSYTATAWLPPRAGQGARIAHAVVKVTDGGLADVTLDISK